MSQLNATATVRGLVTVAALLALAGCASGPAASSASTAGNVSTQAAVQNAKGMTKVQKLVAKARMDGLPDVYALVRNGQTTYCWRGKNIGTLIPSTKCVYSDAQLLQVLHSLEEERHRMMERPQGMCGGKSSCAGN